MRSRTLARARYSADLLARVATGWQRLSDDQRHGVSTAARVAAELNALGAPPAILTTAARVVEDHVRHVEICRRLLEELEAGRPAPLELAIGLPRPATTSEARVARTLIGELALGRPSEAASFAAARAVVREPLFAWAYTQLLHDAHRHATFGAKAAAWVIRHWSPRQRRALWVECLTAGETAGQPRTRDPEAEALGLLPRGGDAALPAWILPHLAPLGLLPRPANDQTVVH
jgi:hypothetical protein